MNIVYSFITILIILLSVDISSEVSVPHLYVFSNEGIYAVLDENYKILKQESLWNIVFLSDQQKKNFEYLTTRLIYDITQDWKMERAFFLLGLGQSEILNGYIVIQSKNLQFINFIDRNMVLGPSFFAITPKGDKIYITYLTNNDSSEYKFFTTIYDGKSYEKLKDYNTRDSLLKLEPSFCFLEKNDILLYTNNHMFDTETDNIQYKVKYIGRSAIPLQCKKGTLLSIAPSEDNLTDLILSNVGSGEILRVIKIENRFRVNRNEWQLSQNGKFVVRDEEKVVSTDMGAEPIKTGKLTFYDTESGVIKETVQIPIESSQDNSILAYSSDGSVLLYRSSNRLIVVDLTNLTVRKSVLLPFRPVGVVWP